MRCLGTTWSAVAVKNVLGIENLTTSSATEAVGVGASRGGGPAAAAAPPAGGVGKSDDTDFVCKLDVR